MKAKFSKIVAAIVAFSAREQRGILLLLPLLVVVSIIFIRFRSPDIDESFTRYSDLAIEKSDVVHSESQKQSQQGGANDLNSAREQTTTLFLFDPNTIDKSGFLELGFTEKQAQGIINYRNAGARFKKAEDFAKCYTVSDEKFAELRPYIKIAGARAETAGGQEAGAETAGGQGSEATAGWGAGIERAGAAGGQVAGAKARFRSGRQAAIQPSVSTTGLSATAGRAEPAGKAEPAGQPTTVAGQNTAESTTTPNIANKTASPPSQPIELNSADSALLVTIRGIGPLTAGRIIRYRSLLGGYASKSQLTEVVGVTEENYLMILQQIYVDNSVIQKIDINFASPKRLSEHPYIQPRTADKILKQRQLKGGWSTIEDMIRDKILTESQAARLWPYLYFSAF